MTTGLVQLKTHPRWQSPVVVGAIGGSGTRALTQILSEAGVHMGAHLDAKTWDSLPMREVLHDGFNSLVSAAFGHAASLPAAMHEALLQALERHRGDITSEARWGWKNPRNAWLIPLLARLFPGLKFIYLVRDGRDVALSGNRFLLRSAGHFLLERQSYTSDEAAQLELWVKGTRWVLECAERYLPDNFLTVRYEDLCDDPRRSIDGMLEFLQLDIAPPARQRLAGLITPSPGIGRGNESYLYRDVPSAAETLSALRYKIPT